MNYDNKIKIWDIIEDDLVLIIKNTSESSQSVVLFDYANFDVNGVVTTYQITIPTASFPITNAFVSFVGGSILTYIGASTKDTLASNLNSVGVPFMTRTTVGSNEIYTYNNTQSSLVALALGGNAFATITFSVTTTQGGASGITITLVNMNYSQFVSSLNMLGGYYFNTLSVYAENSLQAIKPFTLSLFTDLFGKSLTEQVNPILNPFAQNPSCYNVSLYMPMDGNNTITYTIGANQQVILKINTIAYDVLKGFNQNMIHQAPYIVNVGEDFLQPSEPPYYHDTLNKDLTFTTI